MMNNNIKVLHFAIYCLFSLFISEINCFSVVSTVSKVTDASIILTTHTKRKARWVLRSSENEAPDDSVLEEKDRLLLDNMFLACNNMMLIEEAKMLAKAENFNGKNSKL